MKGAHWLAVLWLAAPFQCPSSAPPDREREQSPGEAIYQLSKSFEARGDRSAQVETLRFLIREHPRSRFAETAKVDLEALGASAPATATSVAPSANGSASAP